MQKDNFLDNLPFEIVQHVSRFLDYKSIVGASKISKSWQTLFNDNGIWKFQLKKKFDIDDEQFSQFEKKIKAPNYKQLYVRFYYLSQQRNLPNFIEGIYHDKIQDDLVLLACADNVTCLDETTREQLYVIAILGIYAGCFKIAYSFIEKHADQKLLNNFLEHAATSGNLKLVKYLLNSENKFGLNPDKETLNEAAQTGNLQLVQYLLNLENRLELKPDDYTLSCAAQSGNLKLVQYLLNSENKFELKPGIGKLHDAAESGNLQLVQYLLNVENKFELNPCQDILNGAAISGNLLLVQYLLNPKNKFELNPDRSTLVRAACSGNLQLVQYLLNPDNKFGLNPTKVTLNGAARSGNLQLVQYLLNAKNQFELKPEDLTLKLAAKSGNIKLVQYLLNPDNKFELDPNNDTLYGAALSNLQVVQYLLNPKNKFELTPVNSTLHAAACSGNLQVVQYLLNPDNNFGLEVSPEVLVLPTKKKNFALSEYVWPSHFALQEALKKLRVHDIAAAKTLLQQSYTACPSHYNMMSKSILDNPQRFNLNEESIQCFKAITKKRFLEDGETPNPKRSSLSFN